MSSHVSMDATWWNQKVTENSFILELSRPLIYIDIHIHSSFVGNHEGLVDDQELQNNKMNNLSLETHLYVDNPVCLFLQEGQLSGTCHDIIDSVCVCLFA